MIIHIFTIPIWLIDRHGEGLLLVLFFFYFALLFHIYLWYFIHANTVLTRTLNNNRCMHFLHITHISHSSYICICQTVAATATTTTATNHIVWEVRNRIHSKKNTISIEFLTILNRNQFEGKFYIVATVCKPCVCSLNGELTFWCVLFFFLSYLHFRVWFMSRRRKSGQLSCSIPELTPFGGTHLSGTSCFCQKHQSSNHYIFFNSFTIASTN